MFGPHEGFAGLRGTLHIIFPILDKWIVSVPHIRLSPLPFLTDHVYDVTQPTESSKHVKRGMDNIEYLTQRLTRAKRAQFIEREKGTDDTIQADGKIGGRDLLSLISKSFRGRVVKMLVDDCGSRSQGGYGE
jgi:hypothetical protein